MKEGYEKYCRFYQCEEDECWYNGCQCPGERQIIPQREIQPEQIWNDEKREGLKEFIDKHKQETLEEVALEFAKDHHEMYETSNLGSMHFGFCWGAKWQQEQHDFLPGLTKQFDPKEGEINGEQWTAVHFLKWLELNKFKIVK